MGWRRSFWFPFFGVPRGPLGSVGARVMPILVRPLYAMMGKALDLRPDDDLLDVGCGSATLLAEQAAHVRSVAGLDASEIQVARARRRLAGRLANRTAEIVLGDATALPWEDGRFSVVSSLNCLKFVPDPIMALREMARVLRPGGRLVVTVDEPLKRQTSGATDSFGQWQWNADDVRRMLDEAGFGDVEVTHAATRLGLQLVRAVKRASPPAAEEAATPALAGAVTG